MDSSLVASQPTDSTEVSITVKVPNKTLLTVLSTIALVIGLIL
ncbi:MAG: hypothetical protein AAFY72_19265 [Cyanobacteria bacterium J06649_4]